MDAGATNLARVARSAWLVAWVGLGLALSACGSDVQIALPIGGGVPGVEYVIGNDTPGGTLGTAGNSLGGQPVTVVTQTNLLRFGAIFGGGTATNYQMALYTDSAGAPGTLVISSADTALVIGSQEVSVSPTVLLPGTYWILFVIDNTGNIGDTGGTTVPYRYLNHVYGTTLPGTIGSTTLGPSHEFNLWMVVQD